MIGPSITASTHLNLADPKHVCDRLAARGSPTEFSELNNSGNLTRFREYAVTPKAREIDLYMLSAD